MATKITGAAFASMVLSAAAAIENHKNEINELNVFPVPDGDTGTNMSLTMRAGANELVKSRPETVGRAAELTANALLRGARGNSGVILSLLFRGISRQLKDRTEADASDMAQALVNGVDAAYKAVMKPAEGTILTVSRMASAGAVEAAGSGADTDGVLVCALETGWKAVAATTEQNPVLKKAGVVDAGGKGFMYIVDGMLQALRGTPVQPREVQEEAVKADFTEFRTEDITFTYCTEFIAKRENDKSPELLRGFLDARGDSIVLVSDDEIIKTHVHTNEPGVVLTEALTYGPLLTVKIENMREQHTAKVIDAEQAQQAAGASAPMKEFGLVAVCAGDGLEALFRDIGADEIVSGGQTMNPSTEDILKKVECVPAKTVFVLPNNKNIIMAAQQCAPLTEKNVVVIPTATVPQGVAAALALDPGVDAAENAGILTDAAALVHTALITYAARDSNFDGHDIRAGEYLALLDGALVSSGPDLDLAADALGGALAGFAPDVITVYYGCDTDEDTANEVLGRLSGAVPAAEAAVVYGGQPVYYFIISAETC